MYLFSKANISYDKVPLLVHHHGLSTIYDLKGKEILTFDINIRKIMIDREKALVGELKTFT